MLAAQMQKSADEAMAAVFVIITAACPVTVVCKMLEHQVGDLAPRDAQDLMTYPFFSLAKTHRTTPIDFRMNEIAIRVEAVPEHGMATIWDADVLIWAASQIVEARDAGLRTSRLMVTTPHEILAFTAARSLNPALAASQPRTGDASAAIQRP
jgi:plasmid replication initiation protein